MDEYIRKSDAIEQALAQIHLLDITVRERILNFDGKAQAKTNADRIRAMTDEELAEYLFERGNGDEYCYGICVHQDDVNACVKTLKQNGCIQSVVAWLKQECES